MFKNKWLFIKCSISETMSEFNLLYNRSLSMKKKIYLEDFPTRVLNTLHRLWNVIASGVIGIQLALQTCSVNVEKG